MPVPPQHLFPDPALIPERRARIDRLDARLLRLLEERARVATEIGAMKRLLAPGKPLHVPERERQVIARFRQLHRGPFPLEAAERILREVMSACLSLEQPLKVAFLGPEGTWSHLAALRHFGECLHPLPQPSFDAVFDAVAKGKADYGLVPVENATEGAVEEALDAFQDHAVPVSAELVLPVAHALLLPPGRTLAQVRRIHSHPQALAQCRRWLEAHLPGAERCEAASTAKAAALALEDPEGAAIGSELAGRIHGLEPAHTRIQDHPANATRFLVLGGDPPARTGADRTLLLLKAPDGPGALLKVLEPVARQGLNLSRILSRPSGRTPWEYLFFLDVEAHREDGALVAALEILRLRGAAPRVLGSYGRPEGGMGVAAGQ